MKENDKKTATTVKIPTDLYDEFKILGVRSKISLQTLVEKCVNLFVGDEQFRKQVSSYTLSTLSPEAQAVFSGSLAQ